MLSAVGQEALREEMGSFFTVVKRHTCPFLWIPDGVPRPPHLWAVGTKAARVRCASRRQASGGHAVTGCEHPVLALFRGHGLKMCDGLLHLSAVALGALHLVGVMLLEAQMHCERPVTRTTVIVIGWHTPSFHVCIPVRARSAWCSVQRQ